MSAEPALASVGMTRSWEAFDRFRQGLEFWQRYAVQSGEQDPDALTQAIRGFRAATGVDPAFALAHYRLGLALQKDGQPIAAAEALRTSLNTNPGYPAGARRARVRPVRAREPVPGDVDRPGRAMAVPALQPARDAASASAASAHDQAGAMPGSGAETRRGADPTRCSTKPGASGSPWSAPTRTPRRSIGRRRGPVCAGTRSSAVPP